MMNNTSNDNFEYLKEKLSSQLFGLIFFFFFWLETTKEYIDKKDVQEKDEESSHQRKTKLQGIKYKKIQSKNKQTF